MRNVPYNEIQCSLGNSVFPEFNDKNGLMICGYEWGHSKHDKHLEENHKEALDKKKNEINTFFQKSGTYSSPYDLRIIKWFNIFGHSLGENNGESSFDKCILQTNWCDDQGTYVDDYSKFLSKENTENFLSTVQKFQPSILLFMGAKQIHYLQTQEIKPRFMEIFGDEVQQPEIKQKSSFEGRKFKITFQTFDRINIISFPHPSGSRGLKDDYIRLFSEEVGEVLNKYRKWKRV